MGVEHNEVPKLIPKNEEEEETSDTQPLCLSAETMRRFAVDYEVEEITDESLEDLEIVEACKKQPAALGTSDFDLSDDDLSEISEKGEEEVDEETTIDFIPMGNSDEIRRGKPNEDYVGITSTVMGNDRDLAVAQFACSTQLPVSRDPAEADSDSEARLDPGESAAAAQRRLSADSQSSIRYPEHQHHQHQHHHHQHQLPVSRDPTQADSEARLYPGESAALSADSQSSLCASHQSKSRSRSQLQPEEASEFLSEEMRINMPQPVYSEAYHQDRSMTNWELPPGDTDGVDFYPELRPD